jgi:hypothetical protein
MKILLLLLLLSFDAYSHCSTLFIKTESNIEDIHFESNPLMEIVQINKRTFLIEAFEPGIHNTLQVETNESTQVFKYKNTFTCNETIVLRD